VLAGEIGVSEVRTDAIVAWRLWHVRRHDDTHRLESFTWHHMSWPAQTRFEARCPMHGGAAPARGHECGIYAFRTRELAEDLLRRYTGVRQHYGNHQELPPLRRGCPIALGRVSLWGRILARENGFRAQYAYPYELFLIGGDDGLAGELRRLYAVDVWSS
jgi:hypothetical protein